MNNKPTFSIVITVYNIEAYIGSCIESIQAQKDVDFEIVCVDDCSTDASWETLQSYAKYDDRIKILKTSQNSGLASSRNLGLKASLGRYVYNIDGDDLLAENALETMYKYMNEYDLDMLSFSALSFFDNEELKKHGSRDEYLRKFDYSGIWEGKKLFAELMKNDERVSNNMVLYCFKNSFIKNNTLYLTDGLRYGDDSMFAMFMHAKRVMCINIPLYQRRYRTGSAVTGRMKKVYLESLLVSFGVELDLWLNSRNESDVDEQIARYFDSRMREIDRLYKLFMDDNSHMEYLFGFPAIKYLYELIYKKRSIYDEILDPIIIEKVKQSENVYLYGTGDIADKVTEVLEFHGINEFQYVTTSGGGGEHRSRRICCVDELKTEEDPFILIATSSKYRETLINSANNQRRFPIFGKI